MITLETALPSPAELRLRRQEWGISSREAAHALAVSRNMLLEIETGLLPVTDKFIGMWEATLDRLVQEPPARKAFNWQEPTLAVGILLALAAFAMAVAWGTP